MVVGDLARRMLLSAAVLEQPAMQLVRWLLLLGFLLLFVRGQEEGEEGAEEGAEEGGEEAAPAEEEAAPPAEEEAPAETGEEAAPATDGGKAPAEGEGPPALALGDGGGEEECEVEETDGAESTGDDISDILAMGGEEKKCKKKGATAAPAAAAATDGSGEEASGADALAAAVGATTCDKDGMDEKVAACLGGLETKVAELMTAILGPDGGGGSLEDTITLMLVKKGVISCENETQCDDNKQCLAQPDGMSRCQNPCERPEIIRYVLILNNKTMKFTVRGHYVLYCEVIVYTGV